MSIEGARHADERIPGAAPPICHRCGALLTPGRGNFYVVRIEAFADPSPPDLADPAILETHPDELIERMNDMSERELMDQVYRRMTLLLCRTCYDGWIDQPTG